MLLYFATSPPMLFNRPIHFQYSSRDRVTGATEESKNPTGPVGPVLLVNITNCKLPVSLEDLYAVGIVCVCLCGENDLRLSCSSTKFRSFHSMVLCSESLSSIESISSKLSLRWDLR